jgi:four helix bundle protein
MPMGQPPAAAEIRSYRDLAAWQRAMDLVEGVYAVTRRWPREETYGLTNQVRRAVVSVPANIAEGQGRRNPREFNRFLKIATGSLFEVETHLLIARRLGYLDAAAVRPLLALSDETGRIISGLINSLHVDASD